MSQRTKVVVGLVVVAAVAAGVVAYVRLSGNGSGEDGTTSATLRLKWVVTAGFAGDYCAKHKDLFAKEGLDVEIKTGGPQANPVVLVPGGTDDFGVAGADAVLLARSHGVPVVAIAAVFQRNAAGFFTKEDSGILSPQDWRGRKVGVIAGNDTETIYRALLKKTNMDSSVVTEVPVGFSLTPFLTGQIDVQPGYMTNQPNLLKAKGVTVNIIDPHEHGVSLLGNVYITSERTLRERPDLVRRFLRAVLAGWRLAIEDPDGAVAALVKEDPKLDRGAQLAVLADTITFVRRSDGKVGMMDAETWRTTQEALVAAGALKEEVDVNAAFTNEYLPYGSTE